MSGLRQHLTALFGEAIFEWGLFERYPGSLKFELSTGGSHLQMFVEALDNARLILGPVACLSEQFYVNFTSFQPHPLAAQAELLNAVSHCQLQRLPAEAESVFEPSEDDTDTSDSHHLLLPLELKQLDSVLWLALGKDLGIRPRFTGDIRLFWPQQGLAVHPYDDRGMDVVGPNQELLSLLYRSFAHRLEARCAPITQAYFAEAQHKPAG
ncbi:MAG: DUF3885 domain-containing protein [Candidatus Sericytochromatia bacterium]